MIRAHEQQRDRLRKRDTRTTKADKKILLFLFIIFLLANFVISERIKYYIIERKKKGIINYHLKYWSWKKKIPLTYRREIENHKIKRIYSEKNLKTTMEIWLLNNHNFLFESPLSSFYFDWSEGNRLQKNFNIYSNLIIKKKHILVNFISSEDLLFID